MNRCPERTNATTAKIGAVNNKTDKGRTAGPPAATKTITAGKAATRKVEIGAATRNTVVAATTRWASTAVRTWAGAAVETATCGKAAVSAGATKAENRIGSPDRSAETGRKIAAGNASMRAGKADAVADGPVTGGRVAVTPTGVKVSTKWNPGYGRGDWNRGNWNQGMGGNWNPNQERRRYNQGDWNQGGSNQGEWNQTGWNQGGRQNWNERGGSMQGQHSGRGPRSFKRPDHRIEEDINEQLTRHPMIDASDIEVNVQNAEVTLRGHVDSREAKRMAEDLAESVFGVKEVSNQIKIKNRGEGEERHENESSGKQRDRKAS